MKEYLKLIDHTLLRQDITEIDLQRHCEEAKKYGFYSVVVHPLHVKNAAELLKGSGVLVATVIGFPFGEELTRVKVFQAKCAVEEGAQEIDMVMAVSKAKQGDFKGVSADIAAVVSAVTVPVKVILETALLTKEEIVKACEACIAAKAAFAKTSTGYFGQGATVENVQLMKSVCKEFIKVKAAGGVRTLEDLQAMVNAGASRIGSSSGVKIAEGLIVSGGY